MKKFKQNFLKPFLFLCFGFLIATVAIADSPYDAPDRPGNVEIIAVVENGCELKCIAPKSDGGSPITGYIIERREKSGPWEKVLETFTPELVFVIPNQQPGHEMQFRISAKNLAGRGEPSEPTRFIIIA